MMERSVLGSAIKTYPSKKNRFSSYRPSVLIKNDRDDIFDQLLEDEEKKQPLLTTKSKLNQVKNTFRNTKSYQPNRVSSKVYCNAKRSLVLKNIQNIRGTDRKNRNVIHTRVKSKCKRSKKPGKENTLKCSSRLFVSDSNSDDGLPNSSVYEFSPDNQHLADYIKRRANLKKKSARPVLSPSTKVETSKIFVSGNDSPSKTTEVKLNSSSNSFDEVCNHEFSSLQNLQKPNETIFKKPVPFVENSSDLFFKNSFKSRRQSRTRKKLPFLNENYNNDCGYDADNSFEVDNKYGLSGIHRNSVVSKLFNSEDEKENSDQLVDFTLAAHDNFKPGIVSTPNFERKKSFKFITTPGIVKVIEGSVVNEKKVPVLPKSPNHLPSPYKLPNAFCRIEREHHKSEAFIANSQLRNNHESMNYVYEQKGNNSVNRSHIQSSQNSDKLDNVSTDSDFNKQFNHSALSRNSSVMNNSINSNVNKSRSSDSSDLCKSELETYEISTRTNFRKASLVLHDSLITSFRSLSLSFVEELKNESKGSQTSPANFYESYIQSSNEHSRRDSDAANGDSNQRYSDILSSPFAHMSLSSPNVSTNSEKLNSLTNETEANNSGNTFESIEEFHQNCRNRPVISADAIEVSHEVESSFSSIPKQSNKSESSINELSEAMHSYMVQDAVNNLKAKTDDESSLINDSRLLIEPINVGISSYSINDSKNIDASFYSLKEAENVLATSHLLDEPNKLKAIFSHSINEFEKHNNIEAGFNESIQSTFDNQNSCISPIRNHSLNEDFCGWSRVDYNVALECKQVFANECKMLSESNCKNSNTSLQESDDSFCHVNDFSSRLQLISTRRKKNCPLPTLNEEETEEDVNNNATAFSGEHNSPNQNLSSYSHCHPSFQNSQFFDRTVNRQPIVLAAGKKWRRSFITLKNIRDYGLQLETVNEDYKGRCWKKNVQDLLSSQRDENRNLKEIEECSTANAGSNETIIPSYDSIRVISEKCNRPEKARFSLCVNSKQPDESGGSVTSSDNSNSKLFSDRSFVSFLNQSRECRIENCELEAGDYSRTYSLSLERYNIQDHFSAKEAVLRHCKQSEPLPFEECFNDRVLVNCKKIGEGVYGEVFMLKRSRMHCSVLKIIPIEGDRLINGERQKKFEEIVSELIISIELSNLRKRDDYYTDNFAELQRCWCVYGKYPKRLIDLWNEYDNSKGSDNDSPKVFTEDQLYIILELSHGGEDIESFVFNNAQQALSVFTQVTNALAVAEQAFMFEHRDLHWGNILVSKCKTKETRYIFGDCTKIVKLNGVKVTIIDYTLSRISINNCIVFNDIGQDPDLFTAEGDFQFEVYRLMRSEVRNIWDQFAPKTNIFWLHYLLDKMIKEVRYRRRNTKVHQANLERLEELYELVLEFGSSYDLSRDEYFR